MDKQKEDYVPPWAVEMKERLARLETKIDRYIEEDLEARPVGDAPLASRTVGDLSNMEVGQW